MTLGIWDNRSFGDCVGDGDPQTGKQVREFLRSQFSVLEVQQDMPEIASSRL
jgi:hypothetical protein